MYQYRVTSVGLETKRKASNLNELGKIERKIKYRDDVIAGNVARPSRQKKYKRIADWAKKTGKKYGTCSKCKGKMNLEMAIAQKKNKRPDGVECLACINGYKRKPI